MTISRNGILHLSLLDGIGPVTIQKIVDQLDKHHAWDRIYTFSARDFEHICYVPPATAQAIADGLRNSALLERELALLSMHKISWATVYDTTYPPLLRHIHAPPAVLYWQGDDGLLQAAAIAVIGSRSANYYAQRVINMIIPDLVRAGWVIISGGARGADSYVHQATLDAQGKTVVVLGSGLLKPYPSENIRIFETVCAHGGTVMSSFGLETTPVPGNFPARNRIIAGLARGCIVVQAAAKSGTHSTAQHALEQGKDVFAVPGPIDDPLSAGCHALLQQGAILVQSADDILAELSGTAVQKMVDFGGEKTDQSFVGQPVVERTLADVVVSSCVRPCSWDDLLSTTQTDLVSLQATLLQLQIAGKVQQDMSGKWVSL